MQTFLVEHYRPGLGVEALRLAAALVLRATEAMADEGLRVRCLRTTIVPGDEGFLSVLEASTEDTVREAGDAGQRGEAAVVPDPEGVDRLVPVPHVEEAAVAGDRAIPRGTAGRGGNPAA